MAFVRAQGFTREDTITNPDEGKVETISSNESPTIEDTVESGPPADASSNSSPAPAPAPVPVSTIRKRVNYTSSGRHAEEIASSRKLLRAGFTRYVIRFIAGL